jgi:uncharacterized protein (TIGR02217 family)
MSYIDVKLSDKISQNSTVFIDFKTSVARLSNGKEVRKDILSAPLLRFQINLNIASEVQKDELISVFRLAKGQKHSFRFKDFSDFKATNQPLLKVSPNTLQLQKIYTFGEQNFSRLILKPVKKSVKLYSNGVIISPSSYILNEQTGEVSIIGEFASLSADFEFDTQVRFASDSLPCSLTQDGLFSFKNIELIEVI